MNFTKDRLLLYAVTDRTWVGRKTLYEQIEAALEGGVTMVQLREKCLDDEAFIKEAVQVRKLCHRFGLPLIINDNLSVALKSGADGIHVGIDDMSVKDIRNAVDKDFIIGATAKTVEQAQTAEKSGANYLGVGAVFPSPTKKSAVRITPELLKEICVSVHIPVVAIGGIDLKNLPALAGMGMDGVAVVSALFGAEDIKEAAKRLRALSKEAISS